MVNKGRVKLLGILGCFLIAMAGLSCSAPVETSGTLGATFVGKVMLYDASNNRISQPVKILIPALGRSTVSDDSGRWSMSLIPFGAYDVFATSSGYDTLPYYGIISSGDTTALGTGQLGTDPSEHVTISSVAWSSDMQQWPLTVSGTADETMNEVVVFIDTVPGVAPKDPHFIGSLGYGGAGGNAGKITWTLTAAMSQLDTFKFHSGVKLYFTACAASGFSGINSSRYGFNESSIWVMDPYTGQARVISPGTPSAAYESTYPW